jgi:hypothetical protein
VSDFTNYRVPQIGYVEHTGTIHGYAIRMGQFSQRAWPAVAAITRQAVAGHGADSAIGGYLSHPVAICVGNVDVTVVIDRYSLRLAKDSGCRGASIPNRAGPGEGLYDVGLLRNGLENESSTE